MAFDKKIASLFSKKKNRKKKKNSKSPCRSSSTYTLEDCSSASECSDLGKFMAMLGVTNMEQNAMKIEDDVESQTDSEDVVVSEDNSVHAFSDEDSYAQTLSRNRLIPDVDYVNKCGLKNDNWNKFTYDEINLGQEGGMDMISCRNGIYHALSDSADEESDSEIEDEDEKKKKSFLMGKTKKNKKKLSREEREKRRERKQKEKEWIEKEMGDVGDIRKQRKAILKNQVMPSPAPSSHRCEDLVKIYSIPRWRKPWFGPLIGVVESMIAEEECQGLLPEQCFPPKSKLTQLCWDPPFLWLPSTFPRMPMPPPISLGLPSRATSSFIDFDKAMFDPRPEEPREPIFKRQVYGFDMYGNPVAEEFLPGGIEYAFPEEKEDGPEMIRKLILYQSDSDYKDKSEQEKKRAAENPPENPDDVDKRDRETAEYYMRSILDNQLERACERKSEQKKMEFRIRRKIFEGSYPNTSVEEDKLPSLMRYVWKGKVKKLEKYLVNKRNHEKINRTDHQGRTPLHYAASWGCCRTINMLLEVPGISLNLRDEDGKTPLFKAVEIQNNNAVKILVEKGAKVDVAARDGRNAFEYALQERGDYGIEMIKYLYNQGGMHEKRKEKGKMTFIHLLCLAKKSVPVVETISELLLKENINATEGSGRTALILAAKTKRLDIVKCLLEHHADPLHLDMSCSRALMYAEPESQIYEVIQKAVEKASRKRPRDVQKNDKKLQAQQKKYRESTKTMMTSTGVEVEVSDPIGKHQTRIRPTTPFLK